MERLLRIVLLLFSFLSVSAACAESVKLDSALARLSTDSFTDTATAVEEIAASGVTHAVALLEALGDRRLGFDAADKSVYWRDAAGKLFNAATGQPATATPGELTFVRLNNRVRSLVQAALGELQLLAPDPSRRRIAALAVLKSRDPESLPALQTALAQERDEGIKAILDTARATILLSAATTDENGRLDAIDVLRLPRRPECTGRVEGRACGCCTGSTQRRRSRGPRGRAHACRVGCRSEPLVRPLAGFRAAARRHRPCHHLRRDGRHQHGARRDGHARRLHHLRCAGGDPHQRAGTIRRLASHRHSAGLSRHRRGRRRHRARRDPLSLRPSARDAACDLGREPRASAVRAHGISARPTARLARRPT